jgi:hypothetical protein
VEVHDSLAFFWRPSEADRSLRISLCGLNRLVTFGTFWAAAGLDQGSLL